MQEKLISHQTELSANIVLLCRFLRKRGFGLGPSDEANALMAISLLPIQKEFNFKLALKSVLAKNEYQFRAFDDCYTEFWDQLSKAVDSKTKKVPKKKDGRSEVQKKEAQFESLKNWLNLSPSVDEKSISSYSGLEVLTKKSFSDLSEEEMMLAMQLLRRYAKKINHQKSRLRKKTKQQRRLDLKQTIRLNMRKGVEVQRLVYSKRKDRKLKLVLLCDVSKSMELYSRFFIHLIYAFQNSHDKIETFVFSTALHRVSEILDNYDLEKAYDIISDRVPQWSGGTTIGSCLEDFAKDFGHHLLDKKAIVLILSDGWDTGEPEIMRSAMKFIYKRSKKVVWLNPLAGSPDFSPNALGMKTALPYIDILAPAHNLDSLKQVLLNLQKRRNISKSQYSS